jgi:hypothetical protein
VCNLYVECLLVDGGERFFIVYKITNYCNYITFLKVVFLLKYKRHFTSFNLNYKLQFNCVLQNS